MTDKQFKQLLEKYQAGKCTPEEVKLIQQWYESFESEEDGMQQLSETEKSALEEKISQQIRSRMQAPTNKNKGSLMPYVTISVGVLILLVVGYFSWNWFQNTKQEQSILTIVSKEEIKKVILSDGTLIWLKANSQLSYPREFRKNEKERYVELTGEALFEVAKNPEKPFLIQCGKIEAKVVGTSFNVKQSSEKQQVEVVVLTGKVAVQSAAQSAKQTTPLIVEPMEKVIASPGSFSKMKAQSLVNYFQGTSYHMQFDETPLLEVISRIEQKFDVKIMYNNAASDCRITADFTDQSLETTLQMLTAVLGEVSYQINGNKVLLKGKACQ